MLVKEEGLIKVEGGVCFEQNFSNSLIIQKPKTKEIMHCDVFGYLMKNSSLLYPLFPPQNQFV